MINLPLRSWRCVDADLVRGQLSFGPNHTMRIFNPPVRKGFFVKQSPAYVKADRVQQHGLILRAFTQEEFREHFINKMVTALEPMGPQLRRTLAPLLTRALDSGYPVNDRAALKDAADLMHGGAVCALRVFADAIIPVPHDYAQDPVVALYDFLLEGRPDDWYADMLGGIAVVGSTELPDNYMLYRSEEMLQRIVLAHHYRVPLQSSWAQQMLVALRKDGDLCAYPNFM